MMMRGMHLVILNSFWFGCYAASKISLKRAGLHFTIRLVSYLLVCVCHEIIRFLALV